MNLKSLILISGVAAVIAGAALSGIFYLNAQKEKEAIKLVELEIKEVQADMTDILGQIKNIDTEKDTLEKQLVEQGGKLQVAQSEVLNYQNTKNALYSELSQKEKLLADLTKQLDSIKGEETQLASAFDATKKDYEGVSQQVASARDMKSQLESRLKSYMTAPKGVELKKIIVKVAAASEGKVIEVNSNYNFAIIDLGSADNLKSGDQLAVFRNDKYLTKAVVENVYDEMSSIITLDKPGSVEISSGDKVKLLKA